MVESLEKLVAAMSKLPTIGRKSAWRLALYLMERPQVEAERLAEIIVEARRKIRRCRVCKNYSENELCTICESQSRDKTIICVVEKPTDIFAIENAGRYRGTYHVLGGLLSPLSGVTAEKLEIASLVSRVRGGDVKEVILGLGGSNDAETTSQYIAKVLQSDDVRVTRFARGMPAGLELEHVDMLTLSVALVDRVDVG